VKPNKLKNNYLVMVEKR